MFKRAGILFLSGILFYQVGLAQQSASYTDEFGKFQHAVKLYKQREFSGAQRIFEEVASHTSDPNLEADAVYYDAMAAVHLQSHDAEQRMRNFVENFPESPKRNSAYLNVANLYFKNGEYKTAGNWYEKVNKEKLTSDQQNEYNFNLGYIAFKSDEKETAAEYLSKVDGYSTYGSQAKYYLGYLAYEGDDYKKAQELFEEVDAEDRTDQNVAYFQSNISFKSGDFEKAIAQAKEQMPKANRQEKSELNKIIGESYFNLEQYAEAIPYLEQYEGKRGRWNNTDYYQLGYAYYKQGDYEKAISQFNKIIDGRDAVAQNAYYHLAESYINLDKKQEALNAFKNASEMNYDAEIKEDAALNYAKLSYDIGNNYMSTPEVLAQFLDDYPHSPAKNEIQNLLVDSYVTSKNYKKAMELMEQSSFENDEVYQKVAYLRGVELFKEDEFKSAEDAFTKSLNKATDAEYKAKASFWRAESQYNLKDYSNALKGYADFKNQSAAQSLEEYKNIDYNMGYAAFNKQDYAAAEKYFKNYTALPHADAKQKNDAWVRLGDSYFAQSHYWQAMEEYNKAIDQKGVDNDYAAYQKAISYGFVDRPERKIEDLNAFIKQYPNSLYKADAYYELGNTYSDQNKSELAIQSYHQIENELPNSNFASRAILKQGLIYYNTNQNAQALAKFKKVASDFPNTDEGNQAVTSARNIYVDMGKVEEYADWVKTLSYVEVTDSDIEDAAYESAENRLIDEDDSGAVKGYESYLKKFPNGAHALKAHFHLAQLYYKQDDLSKAAPHYVYVAQQTRNEFSETALERLSRIYLSEKDYAKAIPVLERLEKESGMKEHITFAQSNLMKAYYEQKDYQKTVDYAEKVLADTNAGERAKSDAQIFVARSAIQTGNETKAKEAYAKLLNTADGALGAEAQYYDAYFKRKAGNYAASNESVQILAREYSGYKNYSVKALLLMGKNFYDLKDAYQATYILQNVIDNFKDFPEEIEEAQKELNRIKAEEAKTNSSVEE